MTLQMGDIEAIELSEPRQFISNFCRQKIGIVEAVEVVSIGPGVQRHARLPIRQIQAAPTGSHRTL
ncbi:hypothetical protein [Mycobacterium shottsii]|uniref:hypothetical protein n=1 Tax=Mycobacterium shottsii TaxID=133549 RepID=UPI001E474959|nr:hypothetical protein [Mycobacterium shottsii]